MDHRTWEATGMRIERNTADQLILSYVHWRAALVWGAVALCGLITAGIAGQAGRPGVMLWVALILAVVPGWVALTRAERGQLILDRASGRAELRQRTIKGLHRHRFDLANVQGTRVKRDTSYRNRQRSAKDDPKRILTLYVREGMDEGRYPLSKAQMDAETALETSQIVNDWMKPVRAALQKQGALDSGPNDA